MLPPGQIMSEKPIEIGIGKNRALYSLMPQMLLLASIVMGVVGL